VTSRLGTGKRLTFFHSVCLDFATQRPIPSITYIIICQTNFVPGDGWLLSWSARLLAKAALWVRIQTSFKSAKMGGIGKGVANTLKIIHINVANLPACEDSNYRCKNVFYFLNNELLKAIPLKILVTP
jgi:hypothetical protein